MKQITVTQYARNAHNYGHTKKLSRQRVLYLIKQERELSGIIRYKQIGGIWMLIPRRKYQDITL